MTLNWGVYVDGKYGINAYNIKAIFVNIEDHDFGSGFCQM